MRELTRRHFVRATGGAVAVGTLAGCTDGGGDDAEPSDTPTPSGTTPSDGNGTEPPREMDEYLSEANNYDGTISDQTGENKVTIDVGAGNGLAFGPAAIRVTAGTTVVWEWTGQGGSHNVVSAEDSDAEFESGDPTLESGHTFQQSFDSPSIQLYYCNPHRAQGMMGAIEVVEE